MMIYRVHFVNGWTGSQGFAYYGSKAEAEARRREYLAAHTKDELDNKGISADIESMPTPKTKDQVLRMLYYWAGHPDNG